MATTIKLQSSDNQPFDIERDVAEMSKTIKNMLEDITGISEHPIPLPNVDAKILQKVLEYCIHHKQDPIPLNKDNKAEISPWDENYCKIDLATLFELILAANYLDIKPLLDLTCQTVANMIKGKTTDEIRRTFNIKNDFTPEEEEQVRRENAWCEEQ